MNENVPKPKTPPRSARDRLARLLAGYLPILPLEIRAAVLAALPAPKTATELHTPPPDAKPNAWPDSDRIFVDRDGRAHRVEDLPADLRREVEEALTRPHEILPSNEALHEASLLLWQTTWHLPEVERIAIITAAARGLVELEVRVRDDHRPPLTVERYAAMMCPNCLLFANSAQIPPTLARALVRAGARARDVLVRIWGEAEVLRRQDAIAQRRMWIGQGRVEPPALTERGVSAGGPDT